MVTRTISLKKLVCLILLAGFFQASAAADISARTDRATIGLNESFTLIFESNDPVDGDPDFSPLSKDFDILNSDHSNSVTIINGEMARSRTWSLLLMAKNSGKLTIPAISFGKDKSPKIQIDVSVQSAAGGNSDQKVFLEAEVSSKNIYVQQQLIYTLKLYSSVNLTEYEIGDIQLSHQDVVFKPLGQDKQYTTIIGDKSYLVIEKQIAIFPQAVGKLSISPTQFGAKIRANRRMGTYGFGLFDSDGQVVRGRSEKFNINVKDVPSTFTGQVWLPAESLGLSESWSPNPPTFTVGEPVTRTITLAATGLTAAQLPDINLNIPTELKQYPDQPKLEDGSRSNNIHGTRIEKIALIPTQPGRYTLPPLEVPWWNIKKQSQEIARLPERVIEVAPNSEAPTVAPNKQADTAALEPDAPPKDQKAPSGAGFWPWLTLMFAAGWLATLLFWWHTGSRRPATDKEPGSVSAKKSDPANALKRLHSACRNDDPQATKQALLEWARAYWPDSGMYNLDAISNNVSRELALQIRILSDQLYMQSSIDWQGDDLWRSIENWKTAEEKKESAKSPVLEPLHRI